MPDWAVYLQAAATVASLLLAALAFLRSGRRIDAVMVQEAKDAAVALEARLNALEHAVSHLAGDRDVHEMQGRHADLKGEVAVLTERIGGLDASIRAEIAGVKELVRRFDGVAQRLESFYFRLGEKEHK